MPAWSRKIIHLDMDCFYAAIEQRDNPELRGKPVGVGGSRDRRGVLTTCSYEARPFGVRSAMPTFLALQKCPQLIVVPTRFDVYRRESQRIREIMAAFTSLIEPLSLDEAYLDVSHLAFDPAAIAFEIRERIFDETGLTASAGIATNKLLAKIASDMNKPNGQCVVPPDRVAPFITHLPVRKLWGIGGVSAEKLEARGIRTCGQLQQLSRVDLHGLFGRFGLELYDLCRGIDDRPVQPHRLRKSLSTEETFSRNLTTLPECERQLAILHADLLRDLAGARDARPIRKVFLKIKFANFTRTTVECVATEPSLPILNTLLEQGFRRGTGLAVRLLGAGVRFAEETGETRQMSLSFQCENIPRTAPRRPPRP
jgi:DNA polymerase-4